MCRGLGINKDFQNRVWTPPTPLCEDRQGALSATPGVSIGRGASTHQNFGLKQTRTENKMSNCTLGVSLVGVWNGWGYGIAFFRALNFLISEPEIWQNPLFLQNYRDFSKN